MLKNRNENSVIDFIREVLIYDKNKSLFGIRQYVICPILNEKPQTFEWDFYYFKIDLILYFKQDF